MLCFKQLFLHVFAFLKHFNPLSHFENISFLHPGQSEQKRQPAVYIREENEHNFIQMAQCGLGVHRNMLLHV